jgi:hypothetical protein
MYDTSFKCTYLETESIELYQKELLKAYHCETIDALIPSIDAFYKSIEKTDELKKIVQKIQGMTNLADDFAFYILFSFDLFSYTHDYFMDPTTFTVLYDKIKV